MAEPHPTECAHAAPGSLCDCSCGGTRHATARNGGRPAAGAVTRRAQRAAAKAGIPATVDHTSHTPAAPMPEAEIRRAVADFTFGGARGSGSIDLNAGLRGRAPISDQDADLRDRMDRVFDTVEPSKDFRRVYRMVAGDPGLRKQLVAAARKRGTFTDPGYLSTSASRDLIEDFGMGDDDDVVLEITIGRGTRALDINRYADPDAVGFYDQSEWVLNRGTTLQLTYADRRPGGGWRIVANTVGTH